MDEGGYYFTAILGCNTKLFLAHLSDEEAQAAGRSSEDCRGYFLYERSLEAPYEINIIAQVETDEAAFVLSRMLNMR